MLPQLPHAAWSVAPAAQAPSPAHALNAPQWHVASQVRCFTPQLPHVSWSTAAAMHSPGQPPPSSDAPSAAGALAALPSPGAASSLALFDD